MINCHSPNGHIWQNDAPFRDAPLGCDIDNEQVFVLGSSFAALAHPFGAQRGLIIEVLIGDHLVPFISLAGPRSAAGEPVLVVGAVGAARRVDLGAAPGTALKARRHVVAALATANVVGRSHIAGLI